MSAEQYDENIGRIFREALERQKACDTVLDALYEEERELQKRIESAIREQRDARDALHNVQANVYDTVAAPVLAPASPSGT